MPKDTTGFKCPSCGHRCDPWKARARFLATCNKTYRVLAARGPQSGAEPPHRAQENGPARASMRRFKFPRTTGQSDTIRAQHATAVRYLEGDERAAMRRFIEANEAAVRAVMDHPDDSRFADQWTDWKTELLYETWWAIEAGRDEEGDDA